jgi:hypothetical protein
VSGFCTFLCLGKLNDEEVVDIPRMHGMENFTTNYYCLLVLTPTTPLTDRPNPNSLIIDFPSQPAAPTINSALSLTKF